jgi:hypothetical protein
MCKAAWVYPGSSAFAFCAIVYLLIILNDIIYFKFACCFVTSGQKIKIIKRLTLLRYKSSCLGRLVFCAGARKLKKFVQSIMLSQSHKATLNFSFMLTTRALTHLL